MSSPLQNDGGGDVEGGEGSKGKGAADARELYHHCIIVSPDSALVSYQPLLNQDIVLSGEDGQGSNSTTVGHTLKWWRTPAVDSKDDSKENERVWDQPTSLQDLHGATTIMENDGDLYSLKMTVIGIWMHDMYSHGDAVGRFKSNAFSANTPSMMLDMQMIIQGVRNKM